MVLLAATSSITSLHYLIGTSSAYHVVAVSLPGRVRYVAADLLNIKDTREKLSGLIEVTHIFYAAYQDRPSWAELVKPNLAMLVNIVDTIEPIAPDLQHVSLMQGYKVYGAHLGPFKTPARETDANHMPPEFNMISRIS